jgi:tRNA 2-thiouridine synthesizing protein A
MQFDKELDARGLNCPLPILRAKKALTDMSAGQVLKILATDPGSVKDFQAFCKQTGHELVSHSRGESRIHVLHEAHSRADSRAPGFAKINVTEEVELKLSAAPRTLARLASEPLLGKPRGAPHPRRDLFRYPRCSLWRQGIVLRLRRERGRWVQTVKGARRARCGVHRRIESIAALRSACPELERIPDEDLRKRVAEIIGAKRLVPIFRVEVLRDDRLVSHGRRIGASRSASIAARSSPALRACRSAKSSWS